MPYLPCGRADKNFKDFCLSKIKSKKSSSRRLMKFTLAKMRCFETVLNKVWTILKPIHAFWKKCDERWSEETVDKSAQPRSFAARQRGDENRRKTNTSGYIRTISRQRGFFHDSPIYSIQYLKVNNEINQSNQLKLWELMIVWSNLIQFI